MTWDTIIKAIVRFLIYMFVGIRLVLFGIFIVFFLIALILFSALH